MSNLDKDSTKCVFDSIEEINNVFGVNLTIPCDLPKGCNLLCYIVRGLYDVEFFHPYKLDNSLYHYEKSHNRWSLSNESLDREIAEDKLQTRYSYIYLHLAVKDTANVFTLERLLGVETTAGFINKINYGIKGFVNIGYTTCDPRELKYYISDVSDETVSLDAYVKLFYDTEGIL